MMLSDTARLYTIFEWSPCKRSFSGSKIKPSLSNFVSIAPFQDNVTGILTLDTEVCFVNLKHITPLVVAVHNLERSIVAILFTLLEPQMNHPCRNHVLREQPSPLPEVVNALHSVHSTHH